MSEYKSHLGFVCALGCDCHLAAQQLSFVQDQAIRGAEILPCLCMLHKCQQSTNRHNTQMETDQTSDKHASSEFCCHTIGHRAVSDPSYVTHGDVNIP